jgi:hypothetical protein
MKRMENKKAKISSKAEVKLMKNKKEETRNEVALRAHERFIKSAIKAKITIRDVYGVMED